MTFDERVLRLIRNELARDAETRLDREDGLGDAQVLNQLEDIEDKLDDIHQDLIDCCEKDIQDPFSRTPKSEDPSEKDGDDDNPFFKWIKEKLKDFLMERLRDLFHNRDIPGDEYPDFDTWIKEIDPYGGDVIPNWLNPDWYNSLPGIDRGPMLPPLPMSPLPGAPSLPIPAPALPMGVMLPLLNYMAAGQANKHIQAKLDQLLSRPISGMRGSSPSLPPPADLCCDIIIETIEKEAERTDNIIKICNVISETIENNAMRADSIIENCDIITKAIEEEATRTNSIIKTCDVISETIEREVMTTDGIVKTCGIILEAIEREATRTDSIIKTIEREARRTRTHQGFESV